MGKLRNTLAGRKGLKQKIRDTLARRQRRIGARLSPGRLGDCSQPMFAARTIRYEIGGRQRGLSHGGIGAIHALVKHIGLVDAIDRRLKLFTFHLPYHESDHVLNLAYNALCDGTCLQDIDFRRNDEAFLDALGVRRIPDPTTAGDFCRRFTPAHLEALQDAFDEVRQRVWREQTDPKFFDLAVIDMDGTIVETTGECKRGMDISYDGRWGYHPLLLTLNNTGEVLWLENRPGNRPSHEGAAKAVDRIVPMCRAGGFRKVLLRGDTDFSQTAHIDRWNADGVQFIFGYDAKENLNQIADELPTTDWQPLTRLPDYTIQTQPRPRPENVKDRIVKEREYETLKLKSEDVAEFVYRPTACAQAYRMVVVRKNISVEKGEKVLFPQIRYFFSITNVTTLDCHQIVAVANNRCDQENLLAQLHAGVNALTAPVNSLASNGADMVMTALAWNLKAWWALMLPTPAGRWQDRHVEDKRRVLTMEFKAFAQAFVRLPCLIVRTGRKIVYRLLSWNPQQPIFWRLISALRC